MKDKLKAILAGRHKTRITDDSRVPAAVLLPVFLKENEYHILFIKRTEWVKNHKGQISFPGGGFEREDVTLLNTALRESQEEIGLRTGDVEVLGELDDKSSVTTHFIITPFVGFIPHPYPFAVDGRETEYIIEAPIDTLMDKGHLEIKTMTLEGRPVNVYYYYYRDKVIWGATARILNQFLGVWSEALGQPQP